jgi:hypothetical protein
MHARHTSAARRVGLAAVVFSTLYLGSDAVEAIQGGFSDGQLLLTLAAEAAIPRSWSASTSCKGHGCGAWG